MLSLRGAFGEMGENGRPSANSQSQRLIFVSAVGLWAHGGVVHFFGPLFAVPLGTERVPKKEPAIFGRVLFWTLYRVLFERNKGKWKKPNPTPPPPAPRWQIVFTGHSLGLDPRQRFDKTVSGKLWIQFPFSQRLPGLSMEDPTPPLDTPEVFGVLKTWVFEGPPQK